MALRTMKFGSVPTTPGTSTGAQVPTAAKLSTVLPASVTLAREVQEAIKWQLGADWNFCPISDLRTNYMLLDLAYYMESADHLKQTDSRKIITTLYKELELPILQPNIDAAHAYLVGTFLSGNPVFGVVGEGTERTEAAAQMEAIIEENSRSTGWTRQLGVWLKNCLKYNIGAVEVDWKVRRTFNMTTDTNISFTAATVSEAFRSGNEIRCLDMYNTAFDISAVPADVHTTGDFCINVERVTLAQCHQRVADLKANGGYIMNEHLLWQQGSSGPLRNWYYEPAIRQNKIKTVGTDWVTFFTGNSAPMTNDRTRKYEWITYYRRIIPAMFGMPNVPDANMVQIWKFIEVNGNIIFAERKSNAHNYLPTIFAQPIEDSLGLQTKGVGDNLLPFQNLTGSLFRARVASLARALSDRGLYDPSRISEKHINTPHPTAKIPVRPSAYGTDIKGAYFPVPYDDSNGQMLYQDIGAVSNWASDAAHINKSQRGQFTKGNRTLQEYNDVMDNADSTQQVMAILLEAQAFVPIKTIIKINILQYQSVGTLLDPNTKTAVDINPAELRKAILDFRLADGLLSKDKIMGIPALIEAAQALSAIQQSMPGVPPKYDIVRMLVDALSARGAKLKLYENPPQPAAPQQGTPPATPAPTPQMPVV